MNPFMAFCLYVAARVFVQYLKKTPQDNQIRNALQFLLTAMEAMKRKNPLTESFLVQLHLDIKGNGLDVFFHNPDYTSTCMDGKVRFCRLICLVYQWLWSRMLTRNKTDNNRVVHGFAGDHTSDNEQRPSAGLPGDPQHSTGCSPLIHISETASSDGVTSPQDTRVPAWKKDLASTPQTESPTFRTESPRQTQYAFRSIDLAAREARQMRPLYPEGDQSSQKLHGIFSVGNSWDDGNTFPSGLNPLANNGIGGNGFDTEMSDQQYSSTGLTPQSGSSYNHSSSNTSYSPPNIQDEDASTNQAGANPPKSGTINGYSSFSPSSNNMYSGQYPSSGSGSGSGSVMSPGIGTTNNQPFVSNGQQLNGTQQDTQFKNTGWDIGGGDTPGPIPGMTPGGEWDKMMESVGQGMGWGMTPGNEGNG